ncbi:MAG: hypothetical protein AAGA44_16160 [Pseudomonadota bacterium]
MTDTTRPDPGQSGKNLDTDGVDDLLTAVLELTAEVSALRERVNIWERVLEAKGLPLNGEMNNVSAAFRSGQLIAAERDRLLLDAMEAVRPPGVSRHLEPEDGGPKRPRAA